jgi:hypothetical protein
MKNQEIPKKLKNQLSRLLLNDGEVISKMCRDGTNEVLFQLSQYIIKEKELPSYGQSIYGLFGFFNGKYHLLYLSYTKEMIENEFTEYVVQYAA